VCNYADVDKHGLESVHTKSSAEAAPGLGKPEDRSRHVVRPQTISVTK